MDAAQPAVILGPARWKLEELVSLGRRIEFAAEEALQRRTWIWCDDRADPGPVSSALLRWGLV